MDKHITTRTLVERAEEIMAEAATGATRFIVSGGAADVVVAKMPDADAAVMQDGQARERFGHALEEIWAHVERENLPPLTMDEIDEEIAAYRREKRDAAAKR